MPTLLGAEKSTMKQNAVSSFMALDYRADSYDCCMYLSVDAKITVSAIEIQV